jgi:hypothetical protein
MTFESHFRNFVGRIETLTREETVVLARYLLHELNAEKKIVTKELLIENYPDEDWDEIEKQIKRSKRKRYKWNNIIGESLTKRILKLRKKGLTSQETIDTINRTPGVIEFIELFPEEDSNMTKNIQISVHARYGENKTSERIKQ